MRDIMGWFARGVASLLGLVGGWVVLGDLEPVEGLKWLIVGLVIGLVALAVRVALRARSGPLADH